MAISPSITSTPTIRELETQFQRDYRLGVIDAGIASDIAVGPGSDAAILGTAVSNLTLVAVVKVQQAAKNLSVFDATGQALDDIRAQDGLPEVAASGATGKIRIRVDGSTTVSDGAQFIYPNGVRGVVVGTYLNPSDFAEINVQASETGTRTNLAGGQKVRFVSPPVNVRSEATVSVTDPLSGGTDLESDERKRQRILNARQNRPAGGNWAQLRQIVLDNVPGIQDCYIYPALGGPSSVKVVPVRDFDFDTNDFSRACSSVLLQRARTILQAKNPSENNIIVQASNDETLDAAFQVTIPDSALVGGNGLGWLDPIPWPALEVADGGSVAVTSYTSATRTLVVDAATATAPVAGQTTIAWWSPNDFKFYQALVVSQSGATTAWSLVLDRPLVDSQGNNPAAGQLISPAAKNLDKYGAEWIKLCRSLGTGENTADTGRLPRALRHPYISDEDPSDITSIMSAKIAFTYPEITSISASLSASTPTVPADVDDPPGILVPRHVAFYST